MKTDWLPLRGNPPKRRANHPSACTWARWQAEFKAVDPPLKGRPLHQKSGRSPLWPIVGVIMVVALIFVAYIVMDRRDRPVANESLREPDTVARIVEDRTNHPGTADRSKESDDAARIVRDEAPRPDPRSSTSTLATPTPKPTELLTVNPTATSTGTYASDRIVLVALYNKMGGSGWRTARTG